MTVPAIRAEARLLPASMAGLHGEIIVGRVLDDGRVVCSRPRWPGSIESAWR